MRVTPSMLNERSLAAVGRGGLVVVDTTVATVPFDADRLPEYAAQLYDAGPATPR
ncbi:hypothetical protein FNL39_1032 [Nocardia caishijiensis]|uniref:Uncharacterized protein n=1 Tax=Nocardia caishijiensis TaxID=184756 RepID=A0ABQ6YMW2_9NOCA|nr:hypothetical protein FNL39_1032 [Nocardia caishijiensis]